MAISSRTAIVFNIAAVVVAASAVGAVVRSWMVKPSVAPCETRYSNVLAFKLERDGRVMTPVDLQGRSGGRDIGLDHNVAIGAEPGAPKPLAIKVRLPAGSHAPEQAGSAVGGMIFPWEPANIRPHTAACLAYNVRFSETFDASHNGVLPALEGANDVGDERFSVGAAWLKSGESGLASYIVLRPEPGETPQHKPVTNVDGTEVDLPKGRWLRVNQEIVLNGAGESDGIVRLWIDGKLVVDRTDVKLRSDKAVAFTGVAARAHMLGDHTGAPAQADSSIAFTPFELMW
jgi:hypothetical protein